MIEPTFLLRKSKIYVIRWSMGRIFCFSYFLNKLSSWIKCEAHLYFWKVSLLSFRPNPLRYFSFFSPERLQTKLGEWDLRARPCMRAEHWEHRGHLMILMRMGGNAKAHPQKLPLGIGQGRLFQFLLLHTHLALRFSPWSQGSTNRLCKVCPFSDGLFILFWEF